MKEFDDIWNDIYSAGEQLNRYPWSSVVSFLFRFYPREKPRSSVKILEIGCGAGNNIWCAAREGFDVTGIDASEPAIQYAKMRFEEEGLSARLDVGSCRSLPYEKDEFDIVIERAALTHVPKPVAFDAVREVARVLRPGGYFYSEIFSDRTSTEGCENEAGLVIDAKGPLSNVGQIAFYSKSEILQLLGREFSMLELVHAEFAKHVASHVEIIGNWSLVAQRE
jgi:2-polyprenyl-3-methyl-5-hydroxy-6-metoxy-1,4-benzoquinol methylase